MTLQGYNQYNLENVVWGTFKLLSFPWEKKKPEHTKVAPAVSKEDALKRFEKVAKKTERNQ